MPIDHPAVKKNVSELCNRGRVHRECGAKHGENVIFYTTAVPYSAAGAPWKNDDVPTDVRDARAKAATGFHVSVGDIVWEEWQQQNS